MRQFVTYHRQTGEITGTFSASTDEFLPKTRTPEEEILEVTEQEHLDLLISGDRIRSSPEGSVKGRKIERLRLERRFRGTVTLTVDAEDRDGDGIPELPADGKSVARLRASLHDAEGKAIEQDDVVVRFRVTRGALSRRVAETRGGIAEVELRAGTDTATSQITAHAQGFEPAVLSLEMIPPEELKLLESRERDNHVRLLSKSRDRDERLPATLGAGPGDDDGARAETGRGRPAT